MRPGRLCGFGQRLRGRLRRGDMISYVATVPVVLALAITMISFVRLFVLHLTLQDGASAIAGKLVMIEAAGRNPLSTGAIQDANETIQLLCAAKEIPHPERCSVTVSQDAHHITVRATYPSMFTYLSSALDRYDLDAPVTAASTQRKLYLMQ